MSIALKMSGSADCIHLAQVIAEYKKYWFESKDNTSGSIRHVLCACRCYSIAQMHVACFIHLGYAIPQLCVLVEWTVLVSVCCSLYRDRRFSLFISNCALIFISLYNGKQLTGFTHWIIL